MDFLKTKFSAILDLKPGKVNNILKKVSTDYLTGYLKTDSVLLKIKYAFKIKENSNEV